jgi:hypothetical protein
VKKRGTPCLYVFPDAEPVAMRESSSQKKVSQGEGEVARWGNGNVEVGGLRGSMLV